MSSRLSDAHERVTKEHEMSDATLPSSFSVQNRVLRLFFPPSLGKTLLDIIFTGGRTRTPTHTTPCWKSTIIRPVVRYTSPSFELVMVSICARFSRYADRAAAHSGATSTRGLECNCGSLIAGPTIVVIPRRFADSIPPNDWARREARVYGDIVGSAGIT